MARLHAFLVDLNNCGRRTIDVKAGKRRLHEGRLLTECEMQRSLHQPSAPYTIKGRIENAGKGPIEERRGAHSARIGKASLGHPADGFAPASYSVLWFNRTA